MDVLDTYKRLLYEGRWWFLATVLLFVGAAVAGYFVTLANPEPVAAQFGRVATVLRSVGERVGGASTPIGRAWPIFTNNVRSVFVMLLSGALFGLFPLFGTLVNGVVVGVVAGLGARVSPLAMSPWSLFLTLAPHGVFELPALWLGGAWGMRLGLDWMLPQARGHRNETFKRDARDALLVFFLAVVLLAVAALVEANLTLAIARALRAA